MEIEKLGKGIREEKGIKNKKRKKKKNSNFPSKTLEIEEWSVKKKIVVYKTAIETRGQKVAILFFPLSTLRKKRGSFFG